jgi:large subunit ribosomal protein L25
MSEIVLTASPRTPGSSEARHLRKAGKVPGVYYAKNEQPVHFTVEKLDLRPVVYTSEARIVRLEVAGSKPLDCILKDVTFDPISDEILHFDLLGVKADEMITVEVPIHLIGTSVGVRDGGVIEHVMHKAHVRVSPRNMPEHIDVDITNLGLSTAIHIGDLNMPGVEFTDKPDAVIASCNPPKTHAATTATEGAAEGGEAKA